MEMSVELNFDAEMNVSAKECINDEEVLEKIKIETMERELNFFCFRMLISPTHTSACIQA